MRQCPNCFAVIVWAEKPVLDHRGDCTLVYCNEVCQSEYQAKQSKREPPINRIMLAVLVILAAIIGIVWAAGAQPPPNASGQYSKWFTEQKQLDEPPVCYEEGDCRLKSCCGSPEEEGGDGHFVNVRYFGHDEEIGDRYEVQIGDKWFLYPRPVPRAIDNITGRNVAWYTISSDGQTIHWYCLRISLGV